MRSTIHHSTLTFALLALLLGAGCDKAATPKPASAETRVEDMSRAGVGIRFTFTPPVVRLDRDTILTIVATSASNTVVKIPPLETRAKGFTVAGSYDSPPVMAGGKRVLERHVRLTPRISREYRIAPLAITWQDPDTGREKWFPSKAIMLASESLAENPGKDPEPARGPVWIYPGLKGFIGYTLTALGLAALGYGLWKLARKVQRAVRLRLMSPRERALFELAELVARDLIGHAKVKEFYFELTMIVRLYIERAHAIRAPEQTTEEFLDIVTRDPRFTPDTVKRLREFMRAADLVKYAGVRPDRAVADTALITARGYIETDAHEGNLKSQISNLK